MKRNAFKVTVIVAVVATIGFLASGCSGKEGGKGSGASGTGDASVDAGSVGKVVATAVNVVSSSTDFRYDLNSTSDGIVITGYTGDGGVVVIPGTIEGFPVVEIGSNAFNGKKSITGVVIPATVTIIGNQAFYNLPSVTSITLPEGLLRIGQAAFLSMSGLTSIHIPDSVTHIDARAFGGMSALTRINLPKNLVSLGFETGNSGDRFDGVFQGLSELTELIIPESLDLASLLKTGTFNAGDRYSNANMFQRSMGKLPLATRARITNAGFNAD